MAGLRAVRRPPGPHVHPPCDDAGSRFLGRKNEARKQCVMPKWAPTFFEDENRPGSSTAYRSAPQWGPTPGAVIKSRVRALPFASLRTYSSKPFSSRSRPHAQQEEHTTPHPLSFSLPNHDLTNDSPRGAELPLRARLTACGGRCGSATSFSQFTCVCGCRLPERASPVLDEENARSTRAGMTSNYLLVTYGWLLLFIKSLRTFTKTST